MKKAKKLRFYFINVCYEVQEWREFPKNLTIALPNDYWASRGSYIIIANSYDAEDSVYLGKIYNARKITTFNQAISIREIIEINLDWEKLIISTQGNSAKKILRAEYPILLSGNTSDAIKDKIVMHNRESVSESYFNFNRVVSSCDNPFLAQFIDSFIFALNIFGYGSKYVPVVNEEQILNYDLAGIFPDIYQSSNGDYFFEAINGRLLTVKAIHSVPISKCSAIDLVYYFEDEARAIFIKYESLDNLKNKKIDLSIDYVSKNMLVAKSIPDIAECYNFKATSSDELRLCKCPIYVKLCSRKIKDHRYTPSGFYYPICVWNCIYQNSKKYISFNDEPKISSDQFLELIGSKLIGSNLIQYEQIKNYLAMDNEDQRLKLIFIQSRNGQDIFNR